MRHEPTPSHNPLNAAASQVMQAARECKSPAMEKVAIVTMAITAVASTCLGAVQVVRMFSHDKERAEEKAYQRIKREKEAEDRAHRPQTPHSRGRS